MIITRKDLINYNLLMPMIERNEKKLEKYKKNEPPVSVGKVYGSSVNFPFIPCSYTVGIASSEENRKWKEWKNKCRYLELLIKQDTDKMKNLKANIDEIIAGMSDVQDKLIFEYTIDGKTQEWIARKLSLDQSVISKRIKKYLSD